MPFSVESRRVRNVSMSHRESTRRISPGKEVRQRALTQTVRVVSAEQIPADYFRIPVPNSTIYAKVQVLSSRSGKPVFVEPADPESDQRPAYWAHCSLLPELAQWLSYRVFQEHELFDDE